MEGEKKGGTAVIFKSGGGLYAFDIGSLIEINSRSDVTFVPRLPDYISGVINLMGDVIPVIDFRKRLGLGDREYEYGARSCLMVILSDTDMAAVKVDEVLTSVQYAEDEFLELPDGDSVAAGYIVPHGSQDGERITLIDAAKIFEN
jgi:purine-binding chemotaxis protein CheW